MKPAQSLRYVQGRMAPSEAAEFELEMLGNPALANEVNVDYYMNKGFKALGDHHGIIQMQREWAISILEVESSRFERNMFAS